MTKSKFFCLFSAILLASINIFGQFRPDLPPRSDIKILPVSEIREGMRGTARTVFSGNEAEEFNVEILGVLPNWVGPKQDVIIGRLSGANAERTFVFAGMSGSPVYIGGKLVGAISYAFPFAKEPICGITPFEQMVSTVETSPSKTASVRTPRTFSFAEILSDNWRPDINRRPIPQSVLASGFSSDSMLMAVAGQTIKPITTPVTFSGISQKTLDVFAPELASLGILPVAASAGGSIITPLKKADDKTLVGGDSVTVHLSRGDISLAAAGTVTLRDGNKIYAFGHPFFGLGSISLPMAESHVVTVVPNANNSFKLAVPDAMVGSITQDRATGIFGMLGQTPQMLPVKIRMKTSRGRAEEINFETVLDELLTPLIVSVGVTNAISAHERNVGSTTVELSGEIKIRGEESIKLFRRFAGPATAAFTAAAAAVPLNLMLRGGFDGLDITGVTLDITAVEGSSTATLDRMSTDRTQAHAGETIGVSIFQRTEAGKIIARQVPVTIPKDTAPGMVSITVGDGGAVQQNSAITQFVPQNAAELISTINRLKRPDRLYAVITKNTSGAVIGSSEMPNLPPSVVATLNNDRTTGGLKPTTQTMIAGFELEPSEYIVIGSQTLTVEIVR